MKKFIILLLSLVLTLGAIAQSNAFVVTTDQVAQTTETAEGQLTKPEPLALSWVFNGGDSTVTIVFTPESKVVFKILKVQVSKDGDTFRFLIARQSGEKLAIVISPKLAVLAIGDEHTVFFHHITAINQREKEYTLNF